MRKHLLPTFIAFIIGLTASLAPVEVQAQSNVHIVEAGETLFSIAQRYGTTVSELRARNNLRGDNISVGQRLVVRTWGTTNRPEEPDEDMDYGARPSPPGVRPADLVAPERIPTGPPPPPPPPATINRIDIGRDATQPLAVTAPSGERAEQGTHVVRAGDTLFALARRYGTTVEAIQRANGLRDNRISVGQELLVPGGAPGAVPQLPRPGRYDVRRSTLPDDEVHVVLPGETLFSIAARYGTTAGRVLASNSVSTAPLTPGTILVIPDGLGRLHHRQPASPRIDEAGMALVYPSSYVGRRTISGETYDPDQLTASHRELPFGTILRVRQPDSGMETLVRVNDRGPVSEGYLIELSEAAARALGLQAGSAHEVELTVAR